MFTEGLDESAIKWIKQLNTCRDQKWKCKNNNNKPHKQSGRLSQRNSLPTHTQYCLCASAPIAVAVVPLYLRSSSTPAYSLLTAWWLRV
ncbi:hypothetical protein ACFX11_029339 [Malus domestica]